MKAFLFLLIIVAHAPLNTFGYFVLNDSECSLHNQCSTGGTEQTNAFASIQVKPIIVKGGSYFLESNAGMLLLMKKIEASENVELSELSKICKGTVGKLLKAQNAYMELVEASASIPYDKDFLYQLRSFNYHEFQERTQGINNGVFQEAVWFLVYGDMKGVYTAHYNKVANLYERFKLIDDSIDNGELPPIKALWELNQMYSNTLLFGQYVAQICHEVKQKF